MLARIFRPSKTAMQSGKGKTLEWVLEFEPQDARRQDPLMGWTQTGDTESSQVRLSFETKEEAVRYADQHGKWRLKTFDRKKEADAYQDTVKVAVRQGNTQMRPQAPWLNWIRPAF